jgi:hypothetical protein
MFLLCFSAKASEISKDYGYKLCNYHKFTFMLLKVYDVYLCGNDGEYFKPKEIYKTNFSLIINYNMNFDKEELSKSSIDEINRYYDVTQKDQDAFYEKLMEVFPDVKSGDVIEARYGKNGELTFYHNKLFTGKINSERFSQLFLDIWLYKDNKYQKMTKNLFKINSDISE